MTSVSGVMPPSITPQAPASKTSWFDPPGEMDPRPAPEAIPVLPTQLNPLFAASGRAKVGGMMVRWEQSSERRPLTKYPEGAAPVVIQPPASEVIGRFGYIEKNGVLRIIRKNGAIVTSQYPVEGSVQRRALDAAFQQINSEMGFRGPRGPGVITDKSGKILTTHGAMQLAGAINAIGLGELRSGTSLLGNYVRAKLSQYYHLRGMAPVLGRIAHAVGLKTSFNPREIVWQEMPSPLWRDHLVERIFAAPPASAMELDRKFERSAKEFALQGADRAFDAEKAAGLLAGSGMFGSNDRKIEGKLKQLLQERADLYRRMRNGLGSREAIETKLRDNATQIERLKPAIPFGEFISNLDKLSGMEKSNDEVAARALFELRRIAQQREIGAGFDASRSLPFSFRAALSRLLMEKQSPFGL